ncbi:MAG: histidinol-phosphatase [Clostridia bacterium]|nr:histidinol-phosphatase [Clostridia bacterium]
MLANYHTHTARCHHATGTEEEYVRSAIRAGLQVLGFSDHSPYFFPDGYYSPFRMRACELPDYVNTVRGLRDAYRGQIDIHVGLEVEYYPALFPRLLDFLRAYEIEYLLLGQHFPGEEINMWGSGARTEEESRLRQYCHSVMEAYQTGLFTYHAHPDMMYFVGDDKVYTKYMRQLCREAKACGIPLEINLLGVRDNRHYPTRRFWEIAAEEGCPVVLGYDAHEPEAFANTKQVAAAKALVGELGLALLETVPLRKI